MDCRYFLPNRVYSDVDRSDEGMMHLAWRDPQLLLPVRYSIYLPQSLLFDYPRCVLLS